MGGEEHVGAGLKVVSDCTILWSIAFVEQGLELETIFPVVRSATVVGIRDDRQLGVGEVVEHSIRKPLDAH